MGHARSESHSSVAPFTPLCPTPPLLSSFSSSSSSSPPPPLYSLRFSLLLRLLSFFLSSLLASLSRVHTHTHTHTERERERGALPFFFLACFCLFSGPVRASLSPSLFDFEPILRCSGPTSPPPLPPPRCPFYRTGFYGFSMRGRTTDIARLITYLRGGPHRPRTTTDDDDDDDEREKDRIWWAFKLTEFCIPIEDNDIYLLIILSILLSFYTLLFCFRFFFFFDSRYLANGGALARLNRFFRFRRFSRSRIPPAKRAFVARSPPVILFLLSLFFFFSFFFFFLQLQRRNSFYTVGHRGLESGREAKERRKKKKTVSVRAGCTWLFSEPCPCTSRARDFSPLG